MMTFTEHPLFTKRITDLLFVRAETVFLLYVFTKGEFSNLPPDKKRVVKALVEEIKKEFA